MLLGNIILALCVLYSSQIFGHSRWFLSGSTPPRTKDTGLKKLPTVIDSCGEAARTTVPRQFKPGQQIEVEFEETIDHVGHFEIRFSAADDKNFATYVLAPNIPDNHTDPAITLKATITFPNIKCTTCTLQLTQIMDGSATDYVSCADIQLVDNPMPPPPAQPPAPAKVAPSKVEGLKANKLN